MKILVTIKIENKMDKIETKWTFIIRLEFLRAYNDERGPGRFDPQRTY